jgi:mannosyltransferase OCH1-like enzyme
MNFDGFDNETGAFSYIVPNIIHFIRLNKANFSFTDIIAIRAAHVAQKPDAIYIHTDIKQFEGKYWNQLQKKWPDTYKLIRTIPTEIPLRIFNRSISEGYKFHHASDIIRYRLLSEYGGIYLDNDAFVIHNLNKYRKYEMTIEWNPQQYLGNQVLIGHRDARFLRHCIETFRDYRSDLWYYNGGELPTTAVLYKHPEFIHRVIQKFGTDTDISYHLFTQNWDKWKEFDAIHLLLNHRHYMYKENYKLYPEFNEHTILKYNFTFGEMARLIYYG